MITAQHAEAECSSVARPSLNGFDKYILCDRATQVVCNCGAGTVAWDAAAAAADAGAGTGGACHCSGCICSAGIGHLADGTHGATSTMHGGGLELTYSDVPSDRGRGQEREEVVCLNLIAGMLVAHGQRRCHCKERTLSETAAESARHHGAQVSERLFFMNDHRQNIASKFSRSQSHLRVFINVSSVCHVCARGSRFIGGCTKIGPGHVAQQHRTRLGGMCHCAHGGMRIVTAVTRLSRVSTLQSR
jgi:hypothetical protein